MLIWLTSRISRNEAPLRPCPEAARDLVQIWHYLKSRGRRGHGRACRVGHSGKIVFLAGTPGAGHWRHDLTNDDVRFFPVYSYLIVYRPDTKPLQVIAILHGRRDIANILKSRNRS